MSDVRQNILKTNFLNPYCELPRFRLDTCDTCGSFYVHTFDYALCDEFSSKLLIMTYMRDTCPP